MRDTRPNKTGKTTPVLSSYALPMETKDAIYGRVSRNLRTANEDLNYIAVELERIGKDWQKAGALLASERGVDLDRLTVSADLTRAWELVDKQAALLSARLEAQAQLDRLDA